MDPPPLIRRSLVRLLLHRPRPGVGGAAAEEVEPSGSELLRLLLRLPVPHVSRLLRPRAQVVGTATPPTTTASASTAPSLADFVVVLAVHRLLRLPPPRAGIDDDRPREILGAIDSALLRVMYRIAVDEQPLRATSAVPAARTAIARSLFNRFVYLVLLRVRHLPPQRAALDGDSHPLVMTPVTGNRTTTLRTLLPRLLTRVPLFIPRFTSPSVEALWRAREMVFQSLGGGAIGAGALEFLIVTNTRATRRLMAVSHALFPRGLMSRIQFIAICWSVFHLAMLLGFYSPRTQGGLVGRNELDDGIDEFPPGDADGMNHAQLNAVPNHYVNVADSNQSPGEEVPCLMGGSSVVKGDATDRSSDNENVQAKKGIVISSLEEAGQVVGQLRRSQKLEAEVEIDFGTPESIVNKITLEFAKYGELSTEEAITPVLQKNQN